MKATLIRSGVLVAVLMAIGPPARADFRIKLFDSHGDAGGAGHGGEFVVEQVAGHEFDFTPAGLDESTGFFEVFCLERTEYIDLNTAYRVEINDRAIPGSEGPVGDPISSATAFLYEQFVTGQLVNYVYNIGDGGIARTQSANALQNVLWYLEDEISDLNQGLGGAERSAAAGFLADAIAATSAGGEWYSRYGPASLGSVRVMNLFDVTTGGNRQDQLVMVTPAPGAALLGMAGLGLVGWVRRRQA